MVIAACVLIVVVPIALVANLLCLKHDIEWSDYRVDILERDILSLKRQLDYQNGISAKYRLDREVPDWCPLRKENKYE